MKKLLLTILIVLFASTLTHAQMVGWQKPVLGTMLNRSHPLAPNRAYLFNEGSGNLIQDHGTSFNVTDADDLAWVIRPSGQSKLHINNDNLQASIRGTRSTTSLTQLSVVLLVRLEADAFGPTFLWDWGDAQTDGEGTGIAYRNGPNQYCFSLTGGAAEIEIRSVNTFIPTSESHIVATYNAGQMDFYVDGNLEISSGAAAGAFSPGTNFGIGGPSIGKTNNGFNDTDANQWGGVIYYVYEYNRALTHVEIQSLHREPYQMFVHRSAARHAAFAAAAAPGGVGPPTQMIGPIITQRKKGKESIQWVN